MQLVPAEVRVAAISRTSTTTLVRFSLVVGGGGGGAAAAGRESKRRGGKLVAPEPTFVAAGHRRYCRPASPASSVYRLGGKVGLPCHFRTNCLKARRQHIMIEHVCPLGSPSPASSAVLIHRTLSAFCKSPNPDFCSCSSSSSSSSSCSLKKFPACAAPLRTPLTPAATHWHHHRLRRVFYTPGFRRANTALAPGRTSSGARHKENIMEAGGEGAADISGHFAGDDRGWVWGPLRSHVATMLARSEEAGADLVLTSLMGRRHVSSRTVPLSQGTRSSSREGGVERFEARQSAREAWIDENMRGGVDVITLGNLMVDVVLHVDTLPPSTGDPRKDYMARISVCPPRENHWEAGGNSNFSIAAARIGLGCVSVGHVGDEMFGHFLERVLHKEGVGLIGLGSDSGTVLGGENYDGETLLCWVLIDPSRRHSFCSRFDFCKTPVFNRVRRLPLRAEELIKCSKGLFVNGFAFDEFEPSMVMEVVEFARETGTAIFFDPGPRGKMMMCDREGGKRDTLEKMLRMSTVLLLTSDEAEAITGIADPVSSGNALLDRGGGIEWVVVKRGSRGCVLSTRQSTLVLEGIKVDVVDTVGCGDSFAAAIALGYIRGEKLTTTIALANAVGAATAMGNGAGRNVARAAQVAELLMNVGRISCATNGTEEDMMRMIDGVAENRHAKERGIIKEKVNVLGCSDVKAGHGHHVVNGVEENRKRSMKVVVEEEETSRSKATTMAMGVEAGDGQRRMNEGEMIEQDKKERELVVVSLEDTAFDAIELLTRSLKIFQR